MQTFLCLYTLEVRAVEPYIKGACSECSASVGGCWYVEGDGGIQAAILGKGYLQVLGFGWSVVLCALLKRVDRRKLLLLLELSYKLGLGSFWVDAVQAAAF